MDLQMTFSQWLQEERFKLGQDLRTLARTAGIHTSTLHRIENGVNDPTIETFLKIINALNATPQSLFRILTGDLTSERETISSDGKSYPTDNDVQMFAKAFWRFPRRAGEAVLDTVNLVREYLWKSSQVYKEGDGELNSDQSWLNNLLIRPFTTDELCYLLLFHERLEDRFYRGVFLYPNGLRRDAILEIYKQGGAFVREDFNIISQPVKMPARLTLDEDPATVVEKVDKAEHVYTKTLGLENLGHLKLNDLFALDEVGPSKGMIFLMTCQIIIRDLQVEKDLSIIAGKFLIYLSRWVNYLEVGRQGWLKPILDAIAL